jgi:hypothetical protein
MEILLLSRRAKLRQGEDIFLTTNRPSGPITR